MKRAVFGIFLLKKKQYYKLIPINIRYSTDDKMKFFNLISPLLF